MLISKIWSILRKNLHRSKKTSFIILKHYLNMKKKLFLSLCKFFRITDQIFEISIKKLVPKMKIINKKIKKLFFSNFFIFYALIVKRTWVYTQNSKY